MKQTIGYGLLLTAALAVGTGVAVARMGGTSSTSGPKRTTANAANSSPVYSGSYTGRGRFAQKFLAEYDTNGDGRVTHDEFNRALAHAFAAATKGAPAMNLDEYAAIHLKDLPAQANADFHRIDWNGDGKLTLDEYMAAERDRFEQTDRDGTGVISCGSSRGARGFGAAPPRSRSGSSGGRGAGSRGRSSLCYSYDTNRDGKVTRAEFDKLTAQQFGAFAKGGTLTNAQYGGLVAAQSRAISQRVFQRLDKDRDGKLTLAEFAASQERMFARLDRNNDGTIAEGELTTSRRSRVASRN